MAAYALSIFAGAFLLFQVQPLIAKYILPWFGGGPGVWSACLLFFQFGLLCGYACAHAANRWLSVRLQIVTYLSLLLLCFFFLPIIPSDLWQPTAWNHPVARIFLLLTATVGLPYVLLSSTGPLLQNWFSLSFPRRSPYRLYALSNLGSIIALVTYPTFVETNFTRGTQARLWSVGFILFTLVCAACSRLAWKKGAAVRADLPAQEPAPAVSKQHILLWIGLPAVASLLLMGVTNKLCQDVAVFPFLWVVPLGLYLLSFVVAFDSPRWYRRTPLSIALGVSLFGIAWALTHANDMSVARQICLYCGALFFACLVCHGELYRLRPASSQLTGFYLCIAIGGVLGGAFVAVGAPFLFKDFYELPLGLILCGILFWLACYADKQWAGSWRALAIVLAIGTCLGIDIFFDLSLRAFPAISRNTRLAGHLVFWLLGAIALFSLRQNNRRPLRHWKIIALCWLSFLPIGLAVMCQPQIKTGGAGKVFQTRNFYGVLNVYEYYQDQEEDHYFLLEHGRITHGLQFADRVQRTWPTSYYAETSGIGLAMTATEGHPRNIGLVGLGTGTLASYGRAGDQMRIYEINPQVEGIARHWFYYLEDTKAKVTIVPGDARLSMQREPPQQYDVLALDAFSSDAIPVHLLTREAFLLYLRHLKPGGLIVVHISNHYLDLEPVVVRQAKEFNFHIAEVDYDLEDDWWMYPSTWILLTRDPNLLELPAIKRAAASSAASLAAAQNKKSLPLWTDDYAPVFPLIK
jgi:spermidine synthase